LGFMAGFWQGLSGLLQNLGIPGQLKGLSSESFFSRPP
jgi:hypothetical protein